MKKLIVCIALLVGITPIHFAHADSGSAVALVDAGIAPDAGPTAPPVVTIDLAHLGDSAGSAADAIHQQGWVWGGLAVLLAIGSFLAKKNDETHWIHNPFVLTGGAGLLAVLAAMLNAHFGSASWASVLPVLLGAILLVFQKPKAAA